ncbi:xanthine dehydrogenase family protein molybdopterin-binding subunit [Chondrinema litorale]|uniref:xanthine dehydrogenase family protein molybdopterin-binding subunit n=1 Tax=Chondrinema litorale TaxID=2994555 RepID=UPI002543BFB9|nr:xanthine dehydrogenase family protein molybdopterin-binding subunit [Chondrinema litorale]UZR97173.1 xanthine dehydrogenase family protein molybdopterin-binding subunit [Chondrinema litorale]
MKTVKASGIGQAINRIEGRLKVTGMAKYASEFPVENVVYAQGVTSTIAKGKIKSIDTTEAKNQKGVIEVITHKNAEKLKSFEEERPAFTLTSVVPLLQDKEIHYYGQYIACVVAETFEQAQYACRLIKVTYEEDKPEIHLDKHRNKTYKPTKSADYSRGNMDSGMAEASLTVEETYTTPIEHQHPMELHAAITSWENGKVKMYASQQILDQAKTSISDTFMIPKENVQIIASYLGGGFGSKLNVHGHITLGTLASKMVGRPVQITVTRQQMFTNTGMRQFNEQKMRLGATKDGALTALAHHTLSHTATNLQYYESCGNVSKMLYKTPNNEVTHRLIPLNIQCPNSMRAPGEATGSFALESAMDEMAWKLKMDPIEFRIKNDTQVDLGADKPFSSRLLKECLRIGADKFGWEKRKMQPGANQNGNWLIGYGVSAASRRAPYRKTSAKVIVELKGEKALATIQMDATDIGTGTYTILTQTASEYLDIPVENITVEIGDSNFPVTPGSGGSWGAASYSNGVRVACQNIFKELKQKAGNSNSADTSINALLKANKLDKYEVIGTAEPSEEFKKHSVFSFGANFTEVWVDKDTGIYRIHRMVNVGSAGKIINPKTSYSQIIGGLTMGAGMVIAEQTQVEPNYGNFITRSLADYHVPVNLDMANIDVVFLPEEDKIANEMGVKGIGELGITSVAASITNAIFNATGKRMRHLPVTPEKLITAEVEPGV